MLPIIRRHRQPLLPADDSVSPPPGPPDAAERVAKLNPPSTMGAPAVEVLHPPEIKIRSDSGQFWSDSSPPQPSTLDPQPLWSRQPGEPAADYHLFVDWLRLPAPRLCTKSATALGCSRHRLRRLAVRHHWKTRAAAFDNHRADAASAALDQLLRDEKLDWQERAHRFRLQEWLLHEQMMKAARAAVREFVKHPGRTRPAEIARLIELASVLGRRACGVPVGDTPAPVSEPLRRADVEAALH